ncbi:hypothetical protein LO762_31770 [Actinocorallia sp. API 0066]|uniref:hypothetical protein n=1 Tax=Actinocorallia sp. API 0066 TaxID=2896846 RepID=UPI001E325391|nr:hypothetical protein [Actinocorallia sp. API 0066]MCD0453731.1 hypothetical protein [Actinocorallia sp. API 0066]
MLFKLEARALARAQRAIQSQMEAGEALISYDICRTSGDLAMILAGRGERVDVLLSDRAIYLALKGNSKRLSRIRITDLADIVFTPEPAGDDFAERFAYTANGTLSRLVVLTLLTGEKAALLPMGRQSAMFGPDLVRLFDALVVAEHRIIFQDGLGVTVTQRQGSNPDTNDFTWNYSCDEGIDINVEPWRSEFDDRMRQLMTNVGDPKETTG